MYTVFYDSSNLAGIRFRVPGSAPNRCLAENSTATLPVIVRAPQNPEAMCRFSRRLNGPAMLFGKLNCSFNFLVAVLFSGQLYCQVTLTTVNVFVSNYLWKRIFPNKLQAARGPANRSVVLHISVGAILLWGVACRYTCNYSLAQRLIRGVETTSRMP